MGEITGCSTCGDVRLRPVLDMGLQPIAERYDKCIVHPLELVECARCTLVQLSYEVPAAEVFPLGHPYATGNTKALREHYARLTSEISGDLVPRDLVVDLGANDGTLLDGYGPRVRRVAVEPTNQAVKCLSKGYTTYQVFFNAHAAYLIRKEHGQARVVTACNVLAHARDVHDFLTGVKYLLEDEGVFITENHDVNVILDGLQVDTVYHEHLRYFSITSLTYLLSMHGLVVQKVEPIGTHGGSFRMYARKQNTSELTGRATQVAMQLRLLLDKACAAGPVYGIGATTRATSLVHYAQLIPYIDCVCEVADSEKIGLTIPGTDIPIVDEARLFADQPPYALLLAWHLAGTLVPALTARGYQGKFIVPLPEPKVL
jgi:C-methyltransferase C-terminal domain/Putative zinc binding domain/Methyltransferase domain